MQNDIQEYKIFGNIRKRYEYLKTHRRVLTPVRVKVKGY
jgi:hypothetical protein